MLAFSFSVLFLYAILRAQGHLPFSLGFGGMHQPGVQHRRELHHQYELAVILR